MSPSLVPGSVLVGVDGSPGSDLALSWAAQHARHSGRPLVVLHAVGYAVVTDFAIDLPQSEEDLLAAGRRVTERALEAVGQEQPTVVATAHGVVGDARAVLSRFAEGAEVLVVGSRGRGPLSSLLLGSVSVALAAHAPCPVVVVRPPSTNVPSDELSVVVGVSGAECDTEVLTLAFELASAQRRPLEVVHAFGPAVVFPYPDLLGPDLEKRLDEAADRLLTDSLEGYADKFPDVVVHRRLIPETPSQALVDASGTAAVLIVGCRGRGPTQSHLLGSVSRAVVERAHCTVVVVRGAGQ